MFEQRNKKKQGTENPGQVAAGAQLNDDVLEAAAGGSGLLVNFPDCSNCNGTGQLPDGKKCTHCRGYGKRLIFG